MNSMNRQLNEAINHFAGQPGVTGEQVEQLRGAMNADPALVGRFNAAANAGLIKAFEVESRPGISPAGRLDSSTGVVTIPAESLQQVGTMPSDDLRAVVRVQGMVASFASADFADDGGKKQPMSASMVGNLQTVINDSPALAQEIKRAATTPDVADRTHFALENFAVLPPGSGAGGTYSGSNHTMNLSAASLDMNDASPVARKRDLRALTFVVGHEVRHSFNHGTTVAAWRAFEKEAEVISKSGGPVHDYTQALGDYLSVARTDEAQANIAGWNALLSREQHLDPEFKTKDMPMILNRAGDFVERQASGEITPRPGFTLNKDGSIDETRENVAAMAVNYFDRPSPVYAKPGERSLGLGDSKVLDYKNYYLKEPVERILAAEASASQFHGKRPELTIDAASLGLKEDLLEREGLNLGGRKGPVPYFDSSQLPSSPHFFDSGTKTVTPHQNSVDLHPIVRELREILPEGTSHDRLSQVALAAKQGGVEAGGIRTLDVQGDRLILTGQTPGTRAEVDLSLPPPDGAVSNRELNALQTQQNAQHMEHQQVQHQQSHSGMTMSR
jgi:hypothetical protein